MKYQQRSFKFGYSGSKYAEGWAKAFGKSEDSEEENPPEESESSDEDKE